MGQYSRGGRSRGLVAVKALDHDRYTKLKRVPGGILEPVTGQAFVFLGTSHKTSDFMADGLQLGWRQRGQQLQGIKQLVINLDNGAECNGRRSQFLHRMTQFADTTGLCVRLVYYRPITANTTPSSDIGRDWSRHGMATFSTPSAPYSIASDNTAGEAREPSSNSSIQHMKKASNFAAPKKRHWSNVCCAP